MPRLDALSRLAFSLMRRRGEPAAILLQAAGWTDIGHLVYCGLHHTAVGLGERRRDPRWLCAAIEARAALVQADDVARFTGSIAGWQPHLQTKAAIALARLRLGLPAGVESALPPAIRLAARLAANDAAPHEEPALSDPDSAFLAAAIRAGKGRHRAARQACNIAFAAAGLRPPLDQRQSEPMELRSFIAQRGHGTDDGPVVSIVVAARNAAATVAPAICSLLGQSWRRVEVILVDDASDDATIAIARSAAGSDPRLIVARLAGPSGPYAARNIGLQMARGAYVGFHDADDIAHVDRIALQMGPLLQEGKVASVSRLVRLDECGRITAPRVWPFVRLNPSSVLLPTALAHRLGPFRETILGADGEYLARLALTIGGMAIAWMRFPGTIASQRRDSLTGAARTGLATPEGAGRRTAHVETWVRDHALLLAATREDDPTLDTTLTPPPLTTLSLDFLGPERGSRSAIWT